MPTLFYQDYIHHLTTYLAFLQTKCSFVKSAMTKKGFESIWRKNFLETGQTSSFGNHLMHIQEEHGQQTPCSPTIRTLLWPTPLVPKSSNNHGYPNETLKTMLKVLPLQILMNVQTQSLVSIPNKPQFRFTHICCNAISYYSHSFPSRIF